MSRLSRATAWFLLLVLGLSVGDWPYVDEIFADLAQQQEGSASAKHVTAPLPAESTPRVPDVSRMHAFEILVGIQPVPSRYFLTVARRDRFIEYPDPVFFIPSPPPDFLNRPPAHGSRV